jgi:hypothetical protein
MWIGYVPSVVPAPVLHEQHRLISLRLSHSHKLIWQNKLHQYVFMKERHNLRLIFT